MSEIYVRLLNEGTDVWASVPAEHLGDSSYRLLATEIESEQDCELQYKPGDVVVAATRRGADGQEMMCAVELQK